MKVSVMQTDDGVKVSKLTPGECFESDDLAYYIATSQFNDDGSRTVMDTHGNLVEFGCDVKVKPVVSVLTIDLRKEG